MGSSWPSSSGGRSGGRGRPPEQRLFCVSYTAGVLYPPSAGLEPRSQLSLSSPPAPRDAPLSGPEGGNQESFGWPATMEDSISHSLWPRTILKYPSSPQVVFQLLANFQYF